MYCRSNHVMWTDLPAEMTARTGQHLHDLAGTCDTTPVAVTGPISGLNVLGFHKLQRLVEEENGWKASDYKRKYLHYCLE